MTNLANLLAQGQRYLCLVFLIFLSTGHFTVAQGSSSDPKLSTSLQPDATSLWRAISTQYGMTDRFDNNIKQRALQYTHYEEGFELMLRRASRYLYFVLNELEKRGLPSELALIPFIESGYDPTSKTGVKPMGMWGLMPVAAAHLNMTSNLFWDDRRDIVHSARGALDLLSELHTKFGDWEVAIVAYNWGPGKVSREIATLKAKGLPAIAQNMKLPTITKNYLQKLYALKHIITHPELYGIKLPEVKATPYFTEIDLPFDLDISTAIELSGLTHAEFVALNPGWSTVLIPSQTSRKMLLPVAMKDSFSKKLHLKRTEIYAWTTYKLERTKSLSELAKHLGVPIKTLSVSNRLLPGDTIKAGSVVLAPDHGKTASSLPAELVVSAQIKTQRARD